VEKDVTKTKGKRTQTPQVDETDYPFETA